MLLLEERTDEAVAAGLMKMFSIEWDKEAIIRSVNRFNEEIYYQYIEVYNQIIENKTNLLDSEVMLRAIGL